MTTAVVRSIPPYKGMLDTAGFLLEMVPVAGETPDADLGLALTQSAPAAAFLNCQSRFSNASKDT